MSGKGALRLSIPTKIFLGYTVIVGVVTSILVYNFTRLSKHYEDVAVINRGLVPLRLTLSNTESELRSYLLLLAEQDPVVLRSALLLSEAIGPVPQRVAEGFETSLQVIDELAARALTEDQSELLGNLRRTVEVLSARSFELAERSAELRRVLDGPRDPESIEELRSRLSQSLVSMQGQIASLNRQTGAVVSEALAYATQRQRRSVTVAVVTTALAMGVALLVMLWAARVLRPLTTLTAGVRRLREGAYDTVPVKRRDEIGELATEFNTMVRALEERDRRLREGQEALIAAERLAAIGRMTSQVTHEIRNPLSAIALNIELLEDVLRTDVSGVPDEAFATMAAVTAEIDRLTEITQEYLQFAGLPRPRRRTEDLNEIVAAAVEFQRSDLAQSGVAVDLSLAPELPTLELDEGQLRQALLNLLRNASEAMPGGGRIGVTTRREAGAVALDVSDEGGGMSPEVREHIFDPFFTTKPQGTGLGLPLTAQIVSQHGGEITCRTSPRGTVFAIRFPLAGSD